MVLPRRTDAAVAGHWGRHSRRRGDKCSPQERQEHEAQPGAFALTRAKFGSPAAPRRAVGRRKQRRGRSEPSAHPTTATTRTNSVNTLELDQQLNELIVQGRTTDAFVKYYDENVVAQENDDAER